VHSLKKNFPNFEVIILKKKKNATKKEEKRIENLRKFGNCGNWEASLAKGAKGANA